ncbi:MAG TPA: dTDP-4-dehydrorhamnose reductase, partial [Thermoanaerobaculia bacterium]|nr:dTDP-4-dehydrorhamnose reductase [Thermoanaerobaculia bacterium]
MRTLIFGGTGMLGRAVAIAARRRGFPALALSHAQADVTDAARLLYWAREFRPELVVNAAAHTKVDLCETEREAAFAVNGTAVGHIAAAAAAVGAALLHVSTDYVFRGDATEPYREDSPTAPLSVYGESKLAGEAAARQAGRSLTVRTSWLFGPGGPNFVATIHRLLAAGKPLRVVDDQRGCPTYTPYLAAALLDLAPLAREGREGGVIHYRNREPVTWYGLAREIARLAALPSGIATQGEITPVTTAEFPRPAPRPSYSVLDVSRFEAAVGRRVEPWERGLAEYLTAL